MASAPAAPPADPAAPAPAPAAPLARAVTSLAALARTVADYPLWLLSSAPSPRCRESARALGAPAPLGDYEALERRGLGLGSVVQRALLRGPLGLGARREVALKRKQLPRPGAGSGDGGRRGCVVRQAREAAVLAAAGCRSVLRLNRIVTVPARDELVLEVPYYEWDLDYLLRSGLARGGPHARSVLAQVLGALAHLHALGLAHRDVRPSSLLCASLPSGPAPSQFPRLVLAGLSHAVGASDAAPPPPASRYQSPEAVACAGRPLVRGDWTQGDVWSAGVVAAEVLAGAPLFSAETLAELAEGRGAMPAIEADEGDEDLARLVASLLVARQRRPTAAQALAHSALAGVAGAEGEGPSSSDARQQQLRGRRVVDCSDAAVWAFLEAQGLADVI
eukprot:m51a1_g10337 putative cell division protein kinase (392) ;mRNA; f:120612-121962